MTVLQLIATSGGVAEYAEKDKIVIVRKESRQGCHSPVQLRRSDEGKKLQQNIELMPGDTVIVP